jgi:hypothetical protein
MPVLIVIRGMEDPLTEHFYYLTRRGPLLRARERRASGSYPPLCLKSRVFGNFPPWSGQREQVNFTLDLPSIVGFPNHLRRILVFSESDELGMSQVVGAGPLQELDSCNQLRAHPNTLLHLLRSEPLAPSASGRFGKD